MMCYGVLADASPEQCVLPSGWFFTSCLVVWSSDSALWLTMSFIKKIWSTKWFWVFCRVWCTVAAMCSWRMIHSLICNACVISSLAAGSAGWDDCLCAGSISRVNGRARPKWLADLRQTLIQLPTHSVGRLFRDFELTWPAWHVMCSIYSSAVHVVAKLYD